jgi:hypothetical protein
MPLCFGSSKPEPPLQVLMRLKHAGGHYEADGESAIHKYIRYWEGVPHYFIVRHFSRVKPNLLCYARPGLYVDI